MSLTREDGEQLVREIYQYLTRQSLTATARALREEHPFDTGVNDDDDKLELKWKAISRQQVKLYLREEELREVREEVKLLRSILHENNPTKRCQRRVSGTDTFSVSPTAPILGFVEGAKVVITFSNLDIHPWLSCEAPETCSHIAFGPFGKVLVAASNTKIYLYALQEQKGLYNDHRVLLNNAHSSIQKIFFTESPTHNKEEHLLFIHLADYTTMVYNASTMKEIKTLSRPANIAALKSLAAATIGHEAYIFYGADDGKIIKRGVSEFAIDHSEWQAHTRAIDHILPLKFKEKHYLATASRDGSIKLWSQDKQPTLCHLEEKAHGNWVSSLQFSEKFNMLLSLGDDGLVKGWDIDDNLELSEKFRYRLKYSGVNRIFLSAHGERLYAATSGNVLHSIPFFELEHASQENGQALWGGDSRKSSRISADKSKTARDPLRPRPSLRHAGSFDREVRPLDSNRRSTADVPGFALPAARRTSLLHKNSIHPHEEVARKTSEVTRKTSTIQLERPPSRKVTLTKDFADVDRPNYPDLPRTNTGTFREANAFRETGSFRDQNMRKQGSVREIDGNPPTATGMRRVVPRPKLSLQGIRQMQTNEDKPRTPVSLTSVDLLDRLDSLSIAGESDHENIIPRPELKMQVSPTRSGEPAKTVSDCSGSAPKTRVVPAVIAATAEPSNLLEDESIELSNRSAIPPSRPGSGLSEGKSVEYKSSECRSSGIERELGDSKSGEPQMGDSKQGEFKLTEFKSRDSKSGEYRSMVSADTKSADTKSVRSGEGKSGEGKSGEGKSEEGKSAATAKRPGNPSPLDSNPSPLPSPTGTFRRAAATGTATATGTASRPSITSAASVQRPGTSLQTGVRPGDAPRTAGTPSVPVKVAPGNAPPRVANLPIGPTASRLTAAGRTSAAVPNTRLASGAGSRWTDPRTADLPAGSRLASRVPLVTAKGELPARRVADPTAAPKKVSELKRQDSGNKTPSQQARPGVPISPTAKTRASPATSASPSPLPRFAGDTRMSTLRGKSDRP